MPALQKMVEIHLTDATYYLVLRDLHLRYGIPFLSHTPQILPQRANVDIDPMPLGEALDRLTQIYAQTETEWEYRKYGFLLVRSPVRSNQDRKPTETTNSPVAPVRPRVPARPRNPWVPTRP